MLLLDSKYNQHWLLPALPVAVWIKHAPHVVEYAMVLTLTVCVFEPGDMAVKLAKWIADGVALFSTLKAMPLFHAAILEEVAPTIPAPHFS